MATKYSLKVYRYISFQRFCELLFHQELALVNPSKWPDQYETFVVRTLKNLQHREEMANSFAQYGIHCEKHFNSFIETIQAITDDMFCLCFSRSKDAEVMWNAYNYDNHAVMIRTSVDKLLELDSDSLSIFRVQYDLDRPCLETLLNNTTFTDDGIVLYDGDEIIRHKRKCFKYENEMRLVGSSFCTVPHRIYDGILYLPIKDISYFVERVMVHPLADDGYVALIRKMCMHFGIKFWGRSKIYEFKGM